MTQFRTWLFLSLLTIGLIACGQDSGENVSVFSPDIGSAFAPIEHGERRVAVVYSDTTAKNYFDEFAYSQLFTAMQHQAMQAGIPYDLLDEVDLTNAVALQQYDALIIPLMSNVETANRASIINALLVAQSNGTAIITASEFLTYDQNNNPFPDVYAGMNDILGLTPKSFQVGVETRLRIVNNTHAITADYMPNEKLGDYDQSWFAEFSPLEPAEATALIEARVGNTNHVAMQVLERTARVVHFANDAFMADQNLVWPAVRWAIYGDRAPVSLLPSRSASVFVARNDMDQAMIASQLHENEIPLLDIIKDWKRDYNFVSSYYIDIGNNPIQGQYTDWGVSGPLYQEYLALGSEFGTHSWTHPHFTSELTDAELEFEFNQSKQEISTQLGINVIGGAVPGNPENLNVVENLNQWFDYFSGRSITGALGYRSGYGYLKPEHNMRYFNLNMTPDFGLIDFLNHTPARAEKIWRDEFDALQVNAELPVMHWLWHDYGPTAQAKTGRYSKEMFENTVAYAFDAGSEFVTLEDYHNRLSALEDATLATGVNGEITASVAGSGLGQFALKLSQGQSIASVANWYAYSENAVFMVDGGGDFTIRTGDEPADFTRIVALPMRASLTSLSGNGNELDFSFSGQGAVSIKLSQSMLNNARVVGADTFEIDGNELSLSFDAIDNHSVSIQAIQPVNSKPVANANSATTAYATPVQVDLTASDPNQDALSFSVNNPPANGVLSGQAPALIYTPNGGFSGVDSFSFVANDGSLNSDIATVTVTVSSPIVANSAPVANRAVLNTIVNQSLNVQLSGSDNEGQNLQYAVVSPPSDGSLSGNAPGLTYQPGSNFIGVDEFSFTVSDGVNTSEPARVVIHVSQQPLPINGTVSNALTSSVTIDAQLFDWATSSSFGNDPQEAGISLDNNWKQAWIGHDSTTLFIAYEQYSAVAIEWRNQIYLDTDTNRNTGFNGFTNEYPIGADYIIEGGSLLRYTGTGINWSWESVVVTDAAVNGFAAELAIPRTVLGDTSNINLFFQSVRVDNTRDYYPDDVANANAIDYARQFSYSFTANQNPANAAPIASPQEINTSNNAELPITLSGFDLDADPLSFVLRTQPAHGTLTGSAPNVTYMPSAGFTGVDEFTFSTSDGSLASNTATVIINVASPPAINGVPVALNQSLVTTSNTPIAISLSGSDFEGSALSYSLVSNPASGVLTGNAPELNYTPNAGFSGTDSFTFRVSDGSSLSELATVSLLVNAGAGTGNSPPVAQNQSVVVAYQTAIGIHLAAQDIDGDALTYSIESQPGAGQLSGTAPNLTYTPFNLATGIDSFTFTVHDGLVASSAATVSIDILEQPEVNQAPTAIGQSVSTVASVPVQIELTGTDPNSNALSFRLTRQPIGGSVSGNVPNLVYTPNAGFTGIDRLFFKANDGALDSTETVVTINVSSGTLNTVSNPATGLSIDGDISDWVGLTPFADDPDDVSSANNPLNWRSLIAAHDANNFYFLFRNDGPFTLTWGHGMYIDVDGRSDTGFGGFNDEAPIGADFLIEGSSVHQYTGTGNDFSWNFLGFATAVLLGDTLEFSIPRSLLSNPSQLQLYLQASNAPFGGNIIDYYPDGALDTSRDLSERLLRYNTGP